MVVELCREGEAGRVAAAGRARGSDIAWGWKGGTCLQPVGGGELAAEDEEAAAVGGNGRRLVP